MAESGSFQAVQSENPRSSQEESEEDDDEEDCHAFTELHGLAEPELGGGQLGRSSVGGAELKKAQLETLAVEVDKAESDQLAGLQVNSGVEERVGEEFKEQVGVSNQEVLAITDCVVYQAPEGQIQNQLQLVVCPISSSELSPTSVTQPVSSVPSPMLLEQKALPQKVNISMPETERQNSSKLNVAILKTPPADGFNWRKYGQKLVKSPQGSRSYYKCTYSECFAKRVECCDHSGHVIEMVYKGQHNHDPPRKITCTRENRLLSPTQPVLGNSIVERPAGMANGSDRSKSAKEPIQETASASERKRPSPSNSSGNDEITVKEENVNEPEPKRRVKKDNVAHSGGLLKPGKKPKFVVHAAGDVGISSDGYRWRKYGQKMVKGNPNPRNYYRCTSAGCPVRKHIETAVDNTSAIIITYKGIHDHDMPVPKKRHGPPSAPFVVAAAPVAMYNSQPKKTEPLPNQISSTQWSVDKEGELTGEALDLGGEKAMESARTLLSIGFEIKPC